jgi:hypothetical protein
MPKKRLRLPRRNSRRQGAAKWRRSRWKRVFLTCSCYQRWVQAYFRHNTLTTVAARAPFALHGLIGEAGWFYNGKGCRSALLLVRRENGVSKYLAYVNGRPWVFLIAEDENPSQPEHNVWIDDDPNDAIAPVFFEWAVEAK